MQWEIRGMAEANPRISDTLPRRGRVNEVCREWIVHEDEALAYQLQKQEVEQHYGGNKERNARVREDFPKAKEEQEKEILEAAEKHRQMVRKQEHLDSVYAFHVAERLERDDHERQKRVQQHDLEMARKIQAHETTCNTHQTTNGHPNYHHERRSNVKVSSMNAPPDVNRVGLPLVQKANCEPVDRHQPNLPLTRSLRKLRLNNEDCLSPLSPSSSSSSFPPPPPPEVDVPYPAPSQSPSKLSSTFQGRTNRTRTPPAALLPDDLNSIIRDVDLGVEADKRLQEEKDAELARMLQQQEEEILSEEIDRDRMMAIEAQDKELAKLLYEKEKAKVRRAKERARQRALLKKQQQQQQQQSEYAIDDKVDQTIDESVASCVSSVQSSVEPDVEGMTSRCSSSVERQTFDGGDDGGCEVEEERHGVHAGPPFHSATLTGGRRLAPPPMMNVAMHIDPTYLSQQSSSMPNSLIFQEGETTAPPYMPIQGHRRNTPLPEKKPKKSKSKDGCKQQ